MARRKKGQKIDGWINLHKPVGVTSTQAVGKLRRALNAQKIGHGGTLDPLASGVLPIALGEATKTIPFIQDAMKTYDFTVTWGEQRTTDDAEGDIIEKSDTRPSEGQILDQLSDFMGDIEQLPPQFSAIKINGERAYNIARDGEHADIKPRQTYIEELELISHDENTATLRCHCGKGTYIRSIARDLGLKLECFGYVSMLKRTQVGVFELENAFSLDFFQEIIDNPEQGNDGLCALLPLQTVLDDIPALALKEEEAQKLKNGNALTFLSKADLERLNKAQIDWKDSDNVEALALYEDKALAIVEVTGAKIQPVRVFNL